MLFNVFIGDTDRETEEPSASLLMIKLAGVSDMTEGHYSIQRDLNRLEKWTQVNFIRFSNVKCKVLHLGWGNP